MASVRRFDRRACPPRAMPRRAPSRRSARSKPSRRRQHEAPGTTKTAEAGAKGAQRSRPRRPRGRPAPPHGRARRLLVVPPPPEGPDDHDHSAPHPARRGWQRRARVPAAGHRRADRPPHPGGRGARARHPRRARDRSRPGRRVRAAHDRQGPLPPSPERHRAALPRSLRRAPCARCAAILRERQIDVVAGFGGYVCPPAYLAAFSARLPVVVHEANRRPGLANRLGARRAAAGAHRLRRLEPARRPPDRDADARRHRPPGSCCPPCRRHRAASVWTPTGRYCSPPADPSVPCG